MDIGDIERELSDPLCPHCGEATVEPTEDGKYSCPACGASFDREDIDEAVELDDDAHDA